MKLLTREEFKQQVFQRDQHRCIVCHKPAVDAHHLLERKLFADGGYYLNNGVSLCATCHLQAEQTLLAVEELRQLAHITTAVWPPNFNPSLIYDKWGNQVSGQMIIPGPLWQDPGCQKCLAPKLHRGYQVQYPES